MTAANPVKLIIEPGRAIRHYWRDLWRYRELLYFLAWRDIVVRYKQTVIGVAWALLRPAITMVIFVMFRRLAGLAHTGVPDPILVFAAVLPWQLFSSALAESSSSLIGNANLITKVYFPRLIIPSAAVATSMVEFLITLALLVLIMVWYGFVPGWQLIVLPGFVIIALGLSIGVGLFLAALNVEYRDFRYIIPFILQFGLYVSPIAFRTQDVPEQWRLLYAMNPMVGIIDGFRWSILAGQTSLELPHVLMSLAMTILSLLLGVWYFRRMERGFADVI
jgi:lipopolysaccharide transport system permease protein